MFLNASTTLEGRIFTASCGRRRSILRSVTGTSGHVPTQTAWVPCCESFFVHMFRTPGFGCHRISVFAGPRACFLRVEEPSTSGESLQAAHEAQKL